MMKTKNDAQVTVTVVSADGKPLPNEIVQMFDEKTYEEFPKKTIEQLLRHMH